MMEEYKNLDELDDVVETLRKSIEEEEALRLPGPKEPGHADDVHPEWKNLRTRMREARLDPVKSFLDKFQDAVPGDTKNELTEPKKLGIYVDIKGSATSLWATFTNAKRLYAELRLSDKKREQNVQKDLETSFFTALESLKKLYDTEEVRNSYLAMNAKELAEQDSINGGREAYCRLEEELRKAEMRITELARLRIGRPTRSLYEHEKVALYADQKIIEVGKQKLKETIESTKTLAGYAGYEQFLTYERQFNSASHFIWSPSRLEIKERFVEHALAGEIVLATGNTGTGKTTIFEQISLELTGLPLSNISKEERLDRMLAKRDIEFEKESGRTRYEYEALGEAITGKKYSTDEYPLHDGRGVLFDEFNLREKSEQTNVISFVDRLKPGKEIHLPGTNQVEKVRPKTFYGLAVNLASHRFERNEIPDDVTGKVHEVPVDYFRQSAEEPEIYEAMITALLHGGRLDTVAQAEVSPLYEPKEEDKTTVRDKKEYHQKIESRKIVDSIDNPDGTKKKAGFLWRFAQSVGEINKSREGIETVLSDKGDAQFFGKLSIRIGHFLKWLHDYSDTARSWQNRGGLEAYMVAKVREKFIDVADQTDDDKKLFKEFLAHFDINVDKKEYAPVVLGVPMTTLEIGLLSPRMKYAEVLSEEPVINESHFIDKKTRKRIEYWIKPMIIEGVEYKVGGIFTGPDGKSYEYKGELKNGGVYFIESSLKPTTESKPIPSSSVERASGLLGKAYEQQQNTFAQRLKEFPKNTRPLYSPRLPALLESHQAELFRSLESIFGKGNMEATFMPYHDAITPGYLEMAYPPTQRAEDTTRGLISHRPSWWDAKNEAGIMADLKKYTDPNLLIFTESILKPMYDNGKQMYPNDPLTLLLKTLFGTESRYNLKATNIQSKLLPVLTQKLEVEFKKIDTGLKVEVILTPNPIFNLQTTLTHPENSKTNTWEWSSTPYNTDRLLLSGCSVGGGASYVDDGDPADSNGFRGFRLSVVLKLR